MENRPSGRRKVVVGGSSNVNRRGSGLGTGPVGHRPSRSGGARGTGNRSFGGGKSWLIIIIIAAVVLSVASGSRAKYTQIKGDGSDQITLMVYMCGADLESKSGMATKDLQEMCNATLSNNLNIIVYTGGAKKWNNNMISSAYNQIYKIERGGLSKLENNAGNGAMTDPATLTSFINYATQKFPANRYCLIFWDHGGGSVSGYGYDENNTKNGSLTLADINKALTDGGVKYDFVGFDACLMATVENALMLSSHADYLIASEEVEPGIGWYYTNWLTQLAANPSMETLDIGKMIVDDYMGACAQAGQGQSTTLSVVDLAEAANTVSNKLGTFSESLSTLITDKKYKTVSMARSNTREFSTRSQIDQCDLTHFALNVGNSEGKALADAIKGTVKYNRVASAMSNSYGLSIYFPYRSASKVDAAVKTYKQIGLGDSYSDCIREFASLEIQGQVATGGTTSALPSLLGNLTGGSSSSSTIDSLLSAFMDSDFSAIMGLGRSNTDFLSESSLDTQAAASYISGNYFDSSYLKWQENDDGQQVILMPEDQWNLVAGVELNFFVKDGDGYIDLGMDNVYEFDNEGNLMAPADRTWLHLNGHPVAYYHESTSGDQFTGSIPVLLNGQRVDIMVYFDDDNLTGVVMGARPVYTEAKTDTVAKTFIEIQAGDTIDFLCDYYSLDGEFLDNYYLGDAYIYDGSGFELVNRQINGIVQMTYMFTDIYQQHYWTLPVS